MCGLCVRLGHSVWCVCDGLCVRRTINFLWVCLDADVGQRESILLDDADVGCVRYVGFMMNFQRSCDDEIFFRKPRVQNIFGGQTLHTLHPAVEITELIGINWN